MKRRTCLDCPADLTGTHQARKRCKPCAKERERVYDRERTRKRTYLMNQIRRERTRYLLSSPKRLLKVTADIMEALNG